MKAAGTDGTLCDGGSFITSLAAGIASYGMKIDGQPSTPQTLNEFMIRNGVYSRSIPQLTLLSKFGLTRESHGGRCMLKMPSAICDDKVVLLQLANGGSWVLATGVDGRTFFVKNPKGSKDSYSYEELTAYYIFSNKPLPTFK